MAKNEKEFSILPQSLEPAIDQIQKLGSSVKLASGYGQYSIADAAGTSFRISLIPEGNKSFPEKGTPFSKVKVEVLSPQIPKDLETIMGIMPEEVRQRFNLAFAAKVMTGQNLSLGELGRLEGRYPYQIELLVGTSTAAVTTKSDPLAPLNKALSETGLDKTIPADQLALLREAFLRNPDQERSAQVK